jgi:hypothetical protein
LTGAAACRTCFGAPSAHQKNASGSFNAPFLTVPAPPKHDLNGFLEDLPPASAGELQAVNGFSFFGTKNACECLAEFFPGGDPSFGVNITASSFLIAWSARSGPMR